MSHKLVTDRIEVRSLMKENKPRYIVNGTAMVADKEDIYQYSKNSDGTFKTLKSMFTPQCIESIKRQSKMKKLFVDSQHELALNSNIKSILKGKITSEEEKKIDAMLKTKMLPLAKLNGIEFNDDSIDIETELNPVFRDVDINHQTYFDAVWSSLENKFLNGISINFANPKIIEEEGGLIKIDDIDILGFSYVDAPAYEGNTINEVAIRAMQEGISVRTGEKMEDEKKKIEAEKAKFEEDKKKLEEEKQELEKKKEEEKKKEVEKQAEEHKKTKEELDKKNEELKKIEEEKKKTEAESTSVKGKVTTGKEKIGVESNLPPTKDSKFYKENLKEITSKHDKTIETLKRGQQPMVDQTMSGFGELVFLAGKADDPTADLSKKDAEYVKEKRLLDRGGSDIVTPNPK